MKKIIISLILILLNACSTEVVPPSKALSAPPDRIFKYQSSAGDSKLVITRDSGMVGSACYASVYVNGELAAKLGTKEKVLLNLSHGEYAIGTKLDGSGVCSFGGERQEVYVTTSAGETKYLRIFTDQNGNMDIRPTTLK